MWLGNCSKMEYILWKLETLCFPHFLLFYSLLSMYWNLSISPRWTLKFLTICFKYKIMFLGIWKKILMKQIIFTLTNLFHFSWKPFSFLYSLKSLHSIHCSMWSLLLWVLFPLWHLITCNSQQTSLVLCCLLCTWSTPALSTPPKMCSFMAIRHTDKTKVVVVIILKALLISTRNKFWTFFFLLQNSYITAK